MMIDKKLLKENFLQAAKKSMADGNSNTVYTAEMLYALYDMAKNDVWPDWRFGDDTCNIWSLFHT